MSRSETIVAIGGYGQQPIVIGGKTDFANMDMRDKWEAHKKYGKKDMTITTVNEILLLPEYIEDGKLLQEVLLTIWNSPNEKIFNGIARSLELDEPIKVAYRTLFWKLKELIETVILLYLKRVHNCDIKKTLNKWKKYISNRRIDTSSIILWSLFGERSPSIPEKKQIPLKFTYLGYCPNAPTERIKALMEFPVDKLLEKTKIYNLDFSKIHSGLKGYIGTHFDISDLVKCKKIKVEKTTDFFKFINVFMDAWFKFNDCVKSSLEGLEHHHINKAKKIDGVSKELENIKKQLLIHL